MFRKAVDRSEVRADEIIRAEVDGEDVALYEVDGKVLATSNVCPHAFCLLHENGVVYGQTVECSCHGSTYDIASGENVNPPASDPLPVFSAEVRDGEVFVDLGAALARQAG